jgi:hypothetical protein
MERRASRELVRAVVAVCVGAALVGLAAGATAAEPSRIGPGSRVRVTLLSSGKRFVGRVVEANEHELILRRKEGDKADPLSVPRLDIKRLEVSERPSRKGFGAAIGAAAGVGAAVVVGLAAGESCPDRPSENSLLTFSQSLGSSLCFNRGETALLTALLTIPAGALLGAVMAPGELWQPVDDRNIALSIGFAPGGGVSAGVALRF